MDKAAKKWLPVYAPVTDAIYLIVSIKSNWLYFTSEAMKPSGQRRDGNASYVEVEANGAQWDVTSRKILLLIFKFCC